MDQPEFIAGLKQLRELRDEKLALAEQVKTNNEQIAVLVYDLIEYMEESEQESVKITGLGMCSSTSTKKYSIDKETPNAADSFEQWMREHGELEHVLALNASKLHGYYKEKLELNEELPPGIKTYIKRNITITKG